MASTLSQVIGVEKHLRKKDNEVGSDLKKKVQVPSLVTGRVKTFAPLSDDIPPGQYGPEEYQEVALTVHDALTRAAKYSAAALDIVAVKDKTNQRANADVILSGTAVLKDVPVSHLLFLEDYFIEWRSFLAVLPVLDPSRKWTEDAGRQGLYHSTPEISHRNLPDKVPVVLYAHTEKHPAQVQLVDKQVHVGNFTTVIQSGAVTADRKQHLLDNADSIIAAVKDAISRANRTPAEEVSEGDILMSLLLK
jgi:hypothetical protein